MKKSPSPLPKDAYNRNAEIYKIMANPKRLEMLNILREKEMTVDVLADLLDSSKANISQHLAVLRHNGLVTVRREGVYAYYGITDPSIVEPCRTLHKLRVKRATQSVEETPKVKA